MDLARKTIIGISTLTALLWFVVGWIILIQRPEQGPNMGWFLSHIFFLVGVVLFIPAIAWFRYLLNDNDKKTADIGMALALFGSLALVGQFAIDLAVGQLASNAAELSFMLGEVYSVPLIALSFQIMAITFYVGLFMLILLLTRFHFIARWAGILAIIGIISVVGGSFGGYAIAILFGFVSLWVGLLPIGWRFLTQHISS